jgi:hypothetical protein
MNTLSLGRLARVSLVRRLALGCTLLLGALSGQAYTVNVSSAALYKSANNMPFWADGPMATIKRNSDSFYLFNTDGFGNPPQFNYIGYRYDPLASQQWTKSHSQLVNYNGADSRNIFWITNIFAIGDSNWEFLCFAHTELYDNPNSSTTPRFKIHVLYSRDGGNTWKNCGEIIRPKNYSYGKNIGGTSYLKVGNYFYVYINEHNNSGNKFIGVARANVNDVINAARNSTVTSWKKYSGGSWNQDGKTGLCSQILSGNYDSHMDAAYNRAMGKYIIAVQNYTYNSLDLMSSTNGISWSFEKTLGYSNDSNKFTVYPTFVSLTNTTIDMREFGNAFSVYYALHDFKSKAPLYRVDVAVQ